MTSQDNEFAKKLTTYLDDGTAKLKAGTAYRLQLARAEALSRLSDPRRMPATRTSTTLAGAGGGTGTAGGGGMRMNAKFLAGILVIGAVIDDGGEAGRGRRREPSQPAQPARGGEKA